MENPSKSIIYGNSYENKYGRFMPLCSSITDRGTISIILDYVKESLYFRKYNRVTYAFRVQEVPVVFITEKKNTDLNYYEGSHSDETIEGSGQKLLHLLNKYNIRNVIIVVLIQQFNPLLPFECTNYRIIVENSRLLLDELYRKVINLQNKLQIHSMNDLLFKDNKIIKLKKYDIVDTIVFPSNNTNNNKLNKRNHIFKNGKPNFLCEQHEVQNTNNYEINFLFERCKLMKKQLQNLIQSLTNKQISQLQFYVMYDKNILINQVINMFIIHQGLNSNQQLTQQHFRNLLSFKLEIIQESILKKLDLMIKTNKRLNVDCVMQTNRPIGILFSLMQLRIKYSKNMQRISSLMKKNNKNKQMSKKNQISQMILK